MPASTMISSKSPATYSPPIRQAVSAKAQSRLSAPRRERLTRRNRGCPSTPTITTESVKQISKTKAEYVSAGTVVTDLAYVIEAPRVIQPKPGDTVKVGGVHVGGVVHCEPFPAHGVTVLVKVWVNR